ncbi:MAG: glycosyltransferase family 9 protein [Candidatus Omnitrophica bacterium]|nr:glycosyltransferase family 9 protein [Candidatus Omnitrophota bacterium]
MKGPFRPERILVIRADRLGDVLMNLPAIRLLRQTFPKAWISLLLDESTAELFEGHPDVDEVIGVNAGRLEASLFEKWRLIRRIRKAGFDMAIVSNPHKFFHVLSFLAGISERVGYDRKWGFLLNRKREKAGKNGARHEIDVNLELVGLVSDKRWDGGFSLPADEAADRFVEEWFKSCCGGSERVLAVHPGTSNPRKRWGLECFAELCRNVLKKRGIPVVLVGGGEERGLAQALMKGAGEGVLDLTGKLTLRQLSSFLKHPRVAALVSADSGPVHVAWINGTPVVALYAKDVEGCDPARWGPRDSKSEVIYRPIGEITVQEVCEAVQRVVVKSPLPPLK